jgi:nucleoside-diphosphate-sugar epimerase
MAHVLVTGGTGMLGREMVSRLTQQGHTVRIMSRSASRLTPESDNRLEWAQAALATGDRSLRQQPISREPGG